MRLATLSSFLNKTFYMDLQHEIHRLVVVNAMLGPKNGVSKRQTVSQCSDRLTLLGDTECRYVHY